MPQEASSPLLLVVAVESEKKRREEEIRRRMTIQRRQVGSLRWSLEACAAQPAVAVLKNTVDRPALARAGPSPVRLKKRHSLSAKGTVLAQLIDECCHR